MLNRFFAGDLYHSSFSVVQSCFRARWIKVLNLYFLLFLNYEQMYLKGDFLLAASTLKTCLFSFATKVFSANLLCSTGIILSDCK